MPDPAYSNDNQGKAIAKGCLLFLIFIAFIVIGSGMLVWKNKDTIVDKVSTGVKTALQLPYYGEPDYINAQYGELLRTFDIAAENSSSLFNFAAIIEQIPLPEEIIYFAIEDGDNTTEVLKKVDWSSHSTMVMQGYGAGRLTVDGDTMEIMIYKNFGSWEYMDTFVVYIKHAMGETVPDTYFPQAIPTEE